MISKSRISFAELMRLQLQKLPADHAYLGWVALLSAVGFDVDHLNPSPHALDQRAPNMLSVRTKPTWMHDSHLRLWHLHLNSDFDGLLYCLSRAEEGVCQLSASAKASPIPISIARTLSFP